MRDGPAGVAGLPYLAVRITGETQTGSGFSGSGFLFNLPVGATSVALVITNRHVVEDHAWLSFDFPQASEVGDPKHGPPVKVRADNGKLPIFLHPDADVDLAAIPLKPIVSAVEAGGGTVFPLLMSTANFPPPGTRSALLVATSVLMVGFPNGLMDGFNTLPVVRRGILATPYSADYEGKTDFAVDIAAFGGSSGSPVFAYFENAVPDGAGNVSFFTQPQLYLIGVLHSGPVMSLEGEVSTRPVPTSVQVVSRSSIMINIGICVRAERILDFAPPLLAFLKDRGEPA